MLVGQPSSLYNAVFHALELRRCELGISMEDLCCVAGTAERSYSKGLRPVGASGRHATWPTASAYAEALFGPSYAITFQPAAVAPTIPLGLWRDARGRRQAIEDAVAAQRLASRGWLVRQPDQSQGAAT